ncbi:MAG: hypothetical protein AAFZ15_27705 [Bacteroidota bacterium]
MYNQITYFDPATGNVSVQASEINCLQEAISSQSNMATPPQPATYIHLANGQKKDVTDNFHYLKSQIISDKFYEISGPYFLNTEQINAVKTDEITLQDKYVVFKNGQSVPIPVREVKDLVYKMQQLYPENAHQISQMVS